MKLQYGDRGSTRSAKCTAGPYDLLIRGDALALIEAECIRAGPMETGGILVGHYSAACDVAFVLEATKAPKDSTGGRDWFQRGSKGLGTLLRRRWRGYPRTYYLGEWHYHPVPEIKPSGRDIDQMTEIAGSSAYRCADPLLVIVGAADISGREVKAFVFPHGGTLVEFHRAE